MKEKLFYEHFSLFLFFYFLFRNNLNELNIKETLQYKYRNITIITIIVITINDIKFNEEV